MRIGKTRHANVFREIVMFFQRLINFLFTDGVLRELVTANQQAADNNAAAKTIFFIVFLNEKSALLSCYASMSV
jgi:hypothetical protein